MSDRDQKLSHLERELAKLSRLYAVLTKDYHKALEEKYSSEAPPSEEVLIHINEYKNQAPMFEKNIARLTSKIKLYHDAYSLGIDL